MFIFFTSCKNFEGDIIWRQTNAILSWKRLDIEKKIVILGNDLGVSDFCKKHNLINYIGTKATFSPTLYSIVEFIKENNINENTTFCYLNADIILTESFTKIVNFLNNNTLLDSSLIVGKRNEWFEPKNLNLNENHKINLDEKFINLNNKINGHAHDYFIFNKKWNFLKKCIDKEIGVGEPCYDLHIIDQYLLNNKLVIDASHNINAIHQDHGRYNTSNIYNKLDLLWDVNPIKNSLEIKNFKKILTYDEYNYSIDLLKLKLFSDNSLSFEKGSYYKKKYDNLLFNHELWKISTIILIIFILFINFGYIYNLLIYFLQLL